MGEYKVDASQLPSRIGPDGGQDWGWGLPPSTDPRFIGPPGDWLPVAFCRPH